MTNLFKNKTYFLSLLQKKKSFRVMLFFLLNKSTFDNNCLEATACKFTQITNVTAIAGTNYQY